MDLNTQTLKEKASKHRLFSEIRPYNQLIKSKENRDPLTKVGLFALKTISPESAAVAQATLDFNNHFNDITQQYGTKRRLMYTSGILVAKLGRPFLHKALKELLNLGLAIASCRKETLKANDMQVRNNMSIRCALGFLGASIGGATGANFMPASPNFGYFIGSQLGQTLMQAIPFELFQKTSKGELPHVHEKYWGYGIDNDARIVLQPLRAQYVGVMQELSLYKIALCECIIMYSIAVKLGNKQYLENTKFLLNALISDYKEIRNQHSKKIGKFLLESKKDDPERIKAYRGKLHHYLAEEYHDELVGLIRFSRDELMIKKEIPKERQSVNIR